MLLSNYFVKIIIIDSLVYKNSKKVFLVLCYKLYFFLRFSTINQVSMTNCAKEKSLILTGLDRDDSVCTRAFKVFTTPTET